MIHRILPQHVPTVNFINKKIVRASLFAFLTITFLFIIHFNYNSNSITGMVYNSKTITVDGNTFPSNSHYAYLIRKYPMYATYEKQYKCQLYFTELFKKQPHWQVLIFGGAKDPNDVAAMNDELRHLRVYGKCFMEEEANGASKLKFDKRDNTDQDKDQRKEGHKTFYLLDNLRHLRAAIVGKIKDQSTGSSKTKKFTCTELQSKVFPYLTGRIPTYIRWDGERHNEIPNISEIMQSNKFKDQQFDLQSLDFENDFRHIPKKSAFNLCLVSHLKTQLNGKGIVITTNGKYAPHVISLIKVLRLLGNELPIQIMYSTLSKKRMTQLVQVARKSAEELNMPTEGEELFDRLTDEQKLKLAKFPKQELWFVNMRDTLSGEYEKAMSGFGNKLSALLFATFEDVILMDADAVPLVPIESFFQQTQYQQSQTLFFQDRTDLRYNKDQYVEFFKMLLPNQLDHKLFNIPASTQHTLGNRFLGQKYYYFMEAGLVAINKKQHYVGMLTTFQLGLWRSATSDMLWGDKELYWLGLSISGDENYQFNSKGAVSVGQISGDKERVVPQSSDGNDNSIKSTELCSTHPGQVSDNDNHTLLWINSGFQTCKDLRTMSWDNSQPRYKSWKRIQLREYYKAPLRIEAALEPPMTMREYNVDNENEPHRGWKQTQFCTSYMWCAYDVVNAGIDGNGTSDDAVDGVLKGQLVKYSEEEIRWFDFLGAAWIAKV